MGPHPQEHQALSGGGTWPRTPFTEPSGPAELTARRYPCTHLGPGHAQATVCPLLVRPGRGCSSLALPTFPADPTSFQYPRVQQPLRSLHMRAFPSLCHRCPLTEKDFFLCFSLESFPIKTQISGFPRESGSLGDTRVHFQQVGQRQEPRSRWTLRRQVIPITQPLTCPTPTLTWPCKPRASPPPAWPPGFLSSRRHLLISVHPTGPIAGRCSQWDTRDREGYTDCDTTPLPLIWHGASSRSQPPESPVHIPPPEARPLQFINIH